MGTPEPVAPRPRGGQHVHAELRETRTGWVLTLHADATTAEALRAAGAHAVRPGEVTMAVHPNLVPGVPFELASIVVSEDGGTQTPDDATDDGDRTGDPGRADTGEIAPAGAAAPH